MPWVPWAAARPVPRAPVGRCAGLLRGGVMQRYGKQRKVPSGPRRVTHRVKLTDEHAVRLRAIAEEQGITVARLMVESALSRGDRSPRPRRALVEELARLRSDVQKVGGNVNQIAKVANSTGVVPEGLPALAESVEAAVGSIDATMRRLGSWS